MSARESPDKLHGITKLLELLGSIADYREREELADWCLTEPSPEELAELATEEPWPPIESQKQENKSASTWPPKGIDPKLLDDLDREARSIAKDHVEQSLSKLKKHGSLKNQVGSAVEVWLEGVGKLIEELYRANDEARIGSGLPESKEFLEGLFNCVLAPEIKQEDLRIQQLAHAKLTESETPRQSRGDLRTIITAALETDTDSRTSDVRDTIRKNCVELMRHWNRRMRIEFRKLELKSKSQPKPHDDQASLPPLDPNRQSRPELDSKRLRIQIKGEWYDVTERQCEMLVSLFEAKGNWVRGKDLPGRPHKLLKKMKPAIRKIIETNRHQGYRIPSLLPQ
jgi:hypothetical protein